MTWNPKPLHQIDDNKTEKPRSKQPQQTKARLTGLTIDVSGIRETQETVETLKGSVWETTAKVEQMQRQLDARDQALTIELSKLKDQQDRIEMSLQPILELVDEKRKSNAHLEEVLSHLEDYLNQ